MKVTIILIKFTIVPLIACFAYLHRFWDLSRLAECSWIYLWIGRHPTPMCLGVLGTLRSVLRCEADSTWPVEINAIAWTADINSKNRFLFKKMCSKNLGHQFQYVNRILHHYDLSVMLNSRLSITVIYNRSVAVRWDMLSIDLILFRNHFIHSF